MYIYIYIQGGGAAPDSGDVSPLPPPRLWPDPCPGHTVQVLSSH